jgi:folylpolyglutamate synthase/dihydropteroate synthase
MANIDPRLTQAISEAEDCQPDAPARRIQAVVTLRSKHPSTPLDAAETEKSVRTLVEKAAKQTNAKPNDLVVFANLQSFTIDADAKLISKILDEDHVDSASLNVVPE